MRATIGACTKRYGGLNGILRVVALNIGIFHRSSLAEYTMAFCDITLQPSFG